MQAFTGARKCRCILVNFPPISLLCRQKNCIVNVLSIMLVNVLATVNIFQTFLIYLRLSNPTIVQADRIIQTPFPVGSFKINKRNVTG
jgi:hypothetical protein